MVVYAPGAAGCRLFHRDALSHRRQSHLLVRPVICRRCHLLRCMLLASRHHSLLLFQFRRSSTGTKEPGQTNPFRLRQLSNDAEHIARGRIASRAEHAHEPVFWRMGALDQLGKANRRLDVVAQSLVLVGVKTTDDGCVPALNTVPTVVE